MSDLVSLKLHVLFGGAVLHDPMKPFSETDFILVAGGISGIISEQRGHPIALELVD